MLLLHIMEFIAFGVVTWYWHIMTYISRNTSQKGFLLRIWRTWIRTLSFHFPPVRGRTLWELRDWRGHIKCMNAALVSAAVTKHTRLVYGSDDSDEIFIQHLITIGPQKQTVTTIVLHYVFSHNMSISCYNTKCNKFHNM